MKKFLVFAAFALIFAISCSNSSKTTPDTDSDSDPWSEDSDQSSENDDSDDDAEIPDSGDTDPTPDQQSYCFPLIDPAENDEEDSAAAEGLDYESGFIYLEENEYSLSERDDKSGRARIWYNFQPADKNPQKKPLFVFFNGGPGSSSAIVFLYNTAKKTGDQAFSGEGAADNETNWNQLGNLLYVDARQTGFSYGIIDDPSDESNRSAYFSTSNFNVFTDAADFIRVILRFLKSHPAIKSNPVVLAGESYGGTRATAILNIMQNVADYAEKHRVFYDKALFEEIAGHFRETDPSIEGMPSKKDVVKQFARQILIQPLVMGDTQMATAGELLEQNDSPLYTIQEETGKKYKKCENNSWNCSKYNNALTYVQNAGRDIYSYRRPYNWLFEYTDVATAKMLQMPMFGEFILNDPTKIDELYAKNREGAFRYDEVDGYTRNFNKNMTLENIPEVERIIMKARIEQRNAHPLSSGNLESVFGDLPAYDEYFVDLNYAINFKFYQASVTPYSKTNGEMFLENIKTSCTFITQAEEDIIIYAKGIPESTKKFSGVSDVESGEDFFTVHFSDGKAATVTFPFYPESSHSVSVNQPKKFFNDVKNWLNQ